MMKSKTTRFLSLSVIIAIVVCIVIFAVLFTFINKKNTSTISEVGTIYMSNMSEQISRHFETTIDLRLSQVEALVETLPPGSADDKKLADNLRYTAKARGFDYLGFYSSEGHFEMIYGNKMTVTDPDPFMKSLKENQKKIAVGTDSKGRNIVLMAIPANYHMTNGDECVALVAAVSVDYIRETLMLDKQSLVYSHIIRCDGTFVIRSEDMKCSNYFEYLRKEIKGLNGEDTEEYVTELADAMWNRQNYSGVFKYGNERRHMYGTYLAYSEWYLVTVMPYGPLDQSVSNLSLQCGAMALASCVVILILLSIIFILYLRMSRQQLAELEEARRIAVDANRAKSEFLSNVSHDIRTPMNAIVGMTAIATANIDSRDQVQNCLRKITLSSKHLLGLINDVLDMSKIESGKMTLNVDQVSLREVMDSIVSIVQPQVKAKGQHFSVSIHDIAVESVCCDSVRLNQVLLNLLSNAIKFTPDGGEIRIALYQDESPKGETYVRNHIIVADNGIGMTEEFKEKIFESFIREDSARVRKTEGTGLGMAITKYIVDAMEGTILVESELGKGSTFHITLDMEKSDVMEAEMILPEWNMLVVDDDQQLCESTVEALQSIGVVAEWTLDGESAVELVKARHKQHNEFQIILLDWKLPGMNGIQTAKAIKRELESDIPILLISAYDWSEIEDEAREAGISGFISKPLFRSTLFHGLKGYAEEAILTASHEENRVELMGKKVLLAEDNDLNWEIAEELLGELGLELEWAQNGQICVEKFQASQVGFYDAILMDLRMPVMNGYDATIAIRKLDREDADLPIISMTADAFAEDIKKCLDCGMNAHIAKPIDVQEVSRVLQKHIREKNKKARE